MAQTIKRLSTMWETGVQSLGREDLLEKEMATHSSILAWKIPWTEEPGALGNAVGVPGASPLPPSSSAAVSTPLSAPCGKAEELLSQNPPAACV